MEEFEIPFHLFMCPQCKTELVIKNEKIVCPSCNKAVIQEGRIFDFNELTPKLNLHFTDYLSKLYSVAGQKQNDIHEDWRIHKIVEKLPQIENRSVCLEIGGADGPLTPTLEKRYSIVCSIDLSKPFLQRIESKTKKTLCIFGDAQYLPLLDNTVDVIICSEVLEHVLIPTQLLLEIRRVMKPEGYCILSVPNETNGFFSQSSKANQAISSDAHVNFYNIAHLKKFLLRMGFDIYEIQTIGAPVTWKQIFFLPIRIVKNGSIKSHILCTIRPLNNPDQYWQLLEKNISSEDRKF